VNNLDSRCKGNVKKKILVPHYKENLSNEEMISLSSIRKFFRPSDICFISPIGLDISKTLNNEEKIERFDLDFFQSIAGYNKMLMSSVFYERFTEFSHILICQLDCLVFSDQIDYWTSLPYSYIAAPWFPYYLDDPTKGVWRVGNGGFSMRNVQAHLRVLKKNVVKGTIYPKYGSNPWKLDASRFEIGEYRRKFFIKRITRPLTKVVTVEDELKDYPYNEDIFWSLEAVKHDPLFKVAPANEALSFAFEMSPRWCFEKNNNKLPFGCHAWARYDRTFWEEILIKNI